MSNETKLQTTPDWATAPKWARYFAIDADGMGVYYENAAKLPHGFCQDKGRYFEIGKRFDATNWESSLQKRPENV
jgi:hypothetical protein